MMTPEQIALQRRAKQALFREFWHEHKVMVIRAHVRSDGSHNLPEEVRKRFPNLIPLDIGSALERPVGVSFDENGFILHGLSFNYQAFDVNIPWDDLAALSVGDDLVMVLGEPPRRKPVSEPAPKSSGNSGVTNMADYRRKRDLN